jgi:hypothetical protein
MGINLCMAYQLTSLFVLLFTLRLMSVLKALKMHYLLAIFLFVNNI